jgi:hypothetical protein
MVFTRLISNRMGHRTTMKMASANNMQAGLVAERKCFKTMGSFLTNSLMYYEHF